MMKMLRETLIAAVALKIIFVPDGVQLDPIMIAAPGPTMSGFPDEGVTGKLKRGFLFIFWLNCLLH